jgi:DNA-binding CsgD family transcriptional regulator
MLSARELQIAGLISNGLFEKEIADQLHIAPATVHAHTRKIRTKLHAGNIADITRNYILNHDNTFTSRIKAAYAGGRRIGFNHGRICQTVDQSKRGFPYIRPETYHVIKAIRALKPGEERTAYLLLYKRIEKTNPMSDEMLKKIDLLMKLQVMCTTDELKRLVEIAEQLKTNKQQQDENSK